MSNKVDEIREQMGKLHKKYNPFTDFNFENDLSIEEYVYHLGDWFKGLLNQFKYLEDTANEVTEEAASSASAAASSAEAAANSAEEAGRLIQDGGITTAKLADGAVTAAKVDADFLKTIENAYVTPEMFGAVGDGTTDDTAALNAMFAAVKTAAPSFAIVQDHTVKDLTGIKFLFPNKYRITSTITISGVRGLVIDNLYLYAKTTFTGTALLSFGYDVRSSSIVNCTFDANHIVDNCIEFTDYTLAVTVDSCTLMKFQKKGFYATGNGHELILTNCKIYQYEYSEWTDENLTRSTEGTGIYFDSLRADNHISKCIVNYCVDYGIYIATGPNTLTDCHVYSCPCHFGRNGVNVTGFYFDNSTVELMGGASVRNSLFYIYGNTNAITLSETSGESWRYESSWITGNYINNVNGEDNWSVYPVVVAGSAYTVDSTQLAFYDNSTSKYATQNNVPTSSKRMTPASVPITTDFLNNANVTAQLNKLNSNAAPEQVALTGSNGFVIDVDKTYKIGNLLVINLVGHATQNITGTGAFISLGTHKTIANGSTFICGKGSRWAVSGVQYVYITAYNLNGDISSGEYLHINATLPIN